MKFAFLLMCTETFTVRGIFTKNPNTSTGQREQRNGKKTNELLLMLKGSWENGIQLKYKKYSLSILLNSHPLHHFLQGLTEDGFSSSYHEHCIFTFGDPFCIILSF